MTFSYEISVIFMSLTIFGVYCLAKDLWLWTFEVRSHCVPKLSILILVKNIEQDVEEMIRHLMLAVQTAEVECDVVLCDYESEDLTFQIAERLEREFAGLTAVRAQDASLVMTEALPYARGTTIQILDVMQRIKPEEFFGIIGCIFKPYAKKFIF